MLVTRSTLRCSVAAGHALHNRHPEVSFSPVGKFTTRVCLEPNLVSTLTIGGRISLCNRSLRGILRGPLTDYAPPTQ
jgi:hypothetical protein